MHDDEAEGKFGPPDSDAEDATLADGPDPAFGETDDDELETPTAGEPGLTADF